MKSLDRLWTRRIRKREPAHRSLRLETLETRRVLFASIEFSYAYDELDFFDTAEKREALETAGRIISDRLIDDLSAIQPNPAEGNTWTLERVDSEGVVDTSIRRQNAYLQTGELLVFVWSQEDFGRLARSGFGTVDSVKGSADFKEAVRTRGQGQNDFGTWGGAITFDHNENWSFDGTPSDGEFNFVTTVLHELGHVLGFGISPEWDAFVSDSEFTGANAVNAYDEPGNPPVDGGHWEDGVMDDGQEAGMTVSIAAESTKGFSELDFAALEDIGWEVVPEQGDGGATVFGRVTDQTGSGIPGVSVNAGMCLAGPCLDLGFFLTAPFIGVTNSAGFFSGTVPAAGRWIFTAKGQGIDLQKEQVIFAPALLQELNFSTGTSFSLVETPKFLDVTNDRLSVFGAPEDTNDEIVISRDGDDVVIEVGGLSDRVPLDSIDAIIVDGGGGDDLLTIDFSSGNPIPAGGLRFDGSLDAATGDRLRVLGGSFANAEYNVSAAGEGNILLDDTIIGFTDLDADLIELKTELQDLVVNLANDDPHALLLESIAGQNQSKLSIDGGLQDLSFFNPQTLIVEGGIGDDTLIVDLSDQDLIPPGGFSFAGGDGIDSLKLLRTPQTITYLPDLSNSPDRGTLTIGQSLISFTGLEFVSPVAPASTGVSLSNSVISENGEVAVSGEFLDPGTNSKHTIVVDWGDGNVTTKELAVGSRSFQVSHPYRDDDPSRTPVDVNTIRVSVTDNDALSDAVGTTITVENVAPEIVDVSSDASFETKKEEGELVHIMATFTDVGTLDTHSASIDWGDGTDSLSTVTETDGSGMVSASHPYSTGGIYTITVTLTDDDTGTVAATTTAVVTGVGIKGGVLQIVGTSDNDHVKVNKQGNGVITVHADFLPNGNLRSFRTTDVDSIIAYLCEGDDHLTIAGSIDVAAIIHGGAGNDRISSGGGPSLLMGNGGNDFLNGGSGRDILIGGVGQDRLIGGGEDDVLVGGDINEATLLMDALGAWTSNDDYADRVAALDFLLEVEDDEEEDLLTGGSGRDLFYNGVGDTLNDVKTKKNSETTF